MFSPGDCESLVKSFSLPLLRISEVCLGSLFCCRSNPHFIFSIFTETVIFLKNLMVFNQIHTSLNKAHCDSPKPGYTWRGILFLRLCCLSKLTFAQGSHCFYSVHESCLQNVSCLSNCLFANFRSCIFW